MKPDVEFLPNDFANELAKMSAAEINALPFGIIGVDRKGVVFLYNDAEAASSQRRRERVLGRNFFLDIAPCTRHPAFLGRFLAVRQGKIDQARFRYVFDYDMKARVVTVSLIGSSSRRHFYFLISWGDLPESDETGRLRPEVADAEIEALVESLKDPAKPAVEEELIE